MTDGAANREQGARRASKARVEALETAKGEVRSGYGSARGTIKPELALRDKGLKFFEQISAPGGTAQFAAKFAAETDPLRSYYEKKTSEALDRSLAARGKFGGGAAIEAQGERGASLGAKFAEMSQNRAFDEIGLQERLLDRGRGAARDISNLYTGEAAQLANLSSAIGGARARGYEQIGAARAAGAESQTAALTQIAAVGLAPFTGGMSLQMAGMAQPGGGGGQPAAGAPAAPGVPTVGGAPLPGVPQQPSGGYAPIAPAPVQMGSIAPIAPAPIAPQTGISGNLGFGGGQNFYNQFKAPGMAPESVSPTPSFSGGNMTGYVPRGY